MKKDSTVQPADSLARQTPAGALAIPDFMKDDAEALALNTEFDGTEVKLPQLKLCQALTPERQESDPNFIESLREGHFFNNANGVNYGKGPLKFTMLKFWPNYIQQKPLAEGGGMICRAPGSDCACSQDLAAGRVPRGTVWGAKGEKPKCTRFLNYLLYLIDTNEIVWYSAKITAAPVMLAFNTSVRGMSGVPDFAKVFTLSSADDKNALGQVYKIPAIPRLPVAIVQDAGLYMKLKQLTIDLKDKTVDISEDTDQHEPDGEVRKQDKVPF